MKQHDPYDKAFFDSVDKANTIGERFGTWSKKNGWKAIVIIVTGIAIPAFGILALIHGFYKGLTNKQRSF